MEQQKHSGVGISSFITSITSGVLIFLLVVVAGIIQATGGMNENEGAAMAVGLFLFAFLGLTLVALGLGIAGLMQKERKKIFSTLGTVFSAIILVLTLFLMAIGLAAG